MKRSYAIALPLSVLASLSLLLIWVRKDQPRWLQLLILMAPPTVVAIAAKLDPEPPAK